MRIINAIKKIHPELSRKNIEWLFGEKKVFLNGKAASLKDTVEPDDDLQIESNSLAGDLEADPNVNCQLIHLTPDYVFFAKAPFVHSVAHRVNEKGTAANWLLSVDPELKKVSSSLESGLIHRLDEETSGLMVACRSRKSHGDLKNKFRNRQVIKEYTCLVDRDPPPVGTYRAHAGPHSKTDKKVWIQEEASPGRLKEIVTEVLQVEKADSFMLIRLRLITGYRHQIRAHLNLLGSPLVGDKVYGGSPSERLMLHAERLAFTGLDGEKMDVTCPSPFVGPDYSGRG